VRLQDRDDIPDHGAEADDRNDDVPDEANEVVDEGDEGDGEDLLDENMWECGPLPIQARPGLLALQRHSQVAGTASWRPAPCIELTFEL
jgi:hypothetical protein